MPECKPPREEDQREIRFLGDLQRLQPKPGDVFVLTVEGRVSADMVKILREQWKTFMGDIPLLVIDGGARLGCISAPEPPPPITISGGFTRAEVEQAFGIGAGSGD